MYDNVYRELVNELFGRDKMEEKTSMFEMWRAEKLHVRKAPHHYLGLGALRHPLILAYCMYRIMHRGHRVKTPTKDSSKGLRKFLCTILTFGHRLNWKFWWSYYPGKVRYIRCRCCGRLPKSQWETYRTLYFHPGLDSLPVPDFKHFI